MGAASFLQSSFLGGEWSSLMQGRIDLPKYRLAMNLCQNTIPLEEGACERRSGTELLASTKSGYNARVIGWEPTQSAAYLMEFTDAHVRFFQGNNLLLDPEPPLVSSVTSANPGVFTVTPAVDWQTGDQVEFLFPAGTFPGSSTAPLQNRQFIVIMTSTTTFSLLDAITRAPIDGTGVNFVSSHHPSVGRIVDLITPFTGGSWQNLRWIPFTTNQNATEGVLLSGQQPQLMIAATPGIGTTSFSISPMAFTDGPYLDPVNGAVATMTVGSGTPTFRITVGGSIWTVQSGGLGGYNRGVPVMYQGYYYVSNTGGNSGTNNHVPGTDSGWTLVNPTPPSPDPPYWPAWSAGDAGTYTPWNGGSPPGTIVSHNGRMAIAVNGPTNSFNGATEPNNSQNLNASTWSWVPADYTQVSANIHGVITMELSFAPWDNLLTYGTGDTASFGGISYISLVNGNINNEPDTNPLSWAVTNAGVTFGPNGAQSTDVGRLMRLFYQPQQWNAGTTYQAGQSVTFGNPAAYYTAVVQNTGASPAMSLVDWQPVAGLAFWVSAIVVAVISPTTLRIQISGNLPDATPITLYEVGVYSNTGNQWPTCGCFHGGRLWLAGAVPNRVDSSMSDDPLTWTPTGPDGTVADNNGISFVINSPDEETILWMRSTQQGILVGTLSREWLIHASTTNDPITPATAEIDPITKYGGAFVEPKTTGLATVFVQKYKRQLMEMVANVFSGKYNAPNLALTAKHLTAGQIDEIAYQEELAPVIWARMKDGSLAGCTYRRLSAIQTDNPVLSNEPSTFAAWHRHPLGTGRLVKSIATTLTPDTTLDQLAMVTEDTNSLSVDLPTTPQIWVKIGSGNWNNTLGASPYANIGGISMGTLTAPLYPVFGGDTAFSGSLLATYTGGWNPSDISGLTLSADHETVSAGGESSGWVRALTPFPNTAGSLSVFTVALGPAEPQDLWVGLGTATASLTLAGELPSQMVDVAVVINSGSPQLVVNGTSVLTGFSLPTSTTITFAIGYPQPSLKNLVPSWVEVMQPLADIKDTLLDAWFLDGAAAPSSYQIVSSSDVVFYGYTQWAGKTVTVWAAGLDCGDYVVAADGSVTVPIGAANGLFTLILAQTYVPIPAVIGTCYVTRGQIVRGATPQETGSRIGPAQGETRRNHMFSSLLLNTQGISFGTEFAYMRPAQLAAYESGPIYPVTQLFSGVHWDTLDDNPSFDGMICWEVTRPYPATVVNIGGWVHTSER